MGEKHPNAKHDDETWIGFFERWHAGEASAKLRLEAGVSHDTWTAHARDLKMRRMDLPENHRGRRVYLPLALRDPAFKHPNSLLTEGQWRALFVRICEEGLEPATAGRVYGVSRGAVASQAKARGMRLCDREPGRGRATYDPQAVAGPVYPDDAERTASEAMARFCRAHAEGRVEDAVGIERLDRARHGMEGRRAGGRGKAASAGGAPSITHRSPGGDRPLHRFAVPLPITDGEETDGLVLHDHQTPPTGDWRTWLVLGGRGAGKTVAGASWVADQAARLGAGGRIALIGATLHDVREVMIEGPGGILSLPRWELANGGEGRPTYAPSRRRLRFPGGCEAEAFSAEEPDRLRGPQFHCAWADEFCAWSRASGEGDALAMARLGLRLVHRPQGADRAARPQLVVTTTPRPTQALKKLMGEAGCVVTRAGTGANAAHLAPGFVEGLTAVYGGTRLAAQEIDGQVVDDGLALWSAEMLAACRSEGPQGYEAVVVGVDPSVTADGHACGVVVVARAAGKAWVLADRTVRGLSPEGWARAVVAAAADYEAGAVVVEVNQGGELVTGLLRAVGAGLTVKGVRASVGKRARAEPVAALYEQGRVVHAGAGLERLEEELMAFGHEGEGAVCDLDRADALVWAVTELMLGKPTAAPRVRRW